MSRILVSVALATAALTVATAGGQVDTNTQVEAGSEPAGRILYVTNGNRLNSIDVASGRRTTRRMPVAACGPELFVTGGRVVFAQLGRRRTKVFSVPVALDRRPTRLGTAHLYAPSSVDGRVWLVGTRCTQRRATGMREMTVEGEVTRRNNRRLPRGWLVGATGDGLLLARGRSLFVWDPGTGDSRPPLTVDTFLAMRGNRLLGCTQGTRCRDTAIVDLDSGGKVVPRVPTGYRLDPGAFSPDGAFVAAPAVRNRRWSVALVGTRNGAATIVPGSATESRQYPELAWSASSGWLYFRGADGRVMAYRPGEPRAVRLPFRLPRTAVQFMAG
jgi:hypothetical protein